MNRKGPGVSTQDHLLDSSLFSNAEVILTLDTHVRSLDSYINLNSDLDRRLNVWIYDHLWVDGVNEESAEIGQHNFIKYLKFGTFSINLSILFL